MASVRLQCFYESFVLSKPFGCRLPFSEINQNKNDKEFNLLREKIFLPPPPLLRDIKSIMGIVLV